MGALGTREGEGLRFLRSLTLGTTDCIEYPFGKFQATGYGRVREGGRARPAHVVSFELHVGSVLPGFEVCHNCGNRPCVNPAHLRADSHRANMADCVAHGTHTRGARNGRAKLTADQVVDIRRAVAGGAQQKALARSLGVSPQTINHIVKRRTWAADEIAYVVD